ncbi:MAG TPA: sigma-70 family RNA polymerase sigma factor [Bryobacteraceae bacterium]|nr:sigma-70 family RNA polymerase sigma factor [Bryobacteraceae bacterium]
MRKPRFFKWKPDEENTPATGSGGGYEAIMAAAALAMVSGAPFQQRTDSGGQYWIKQSLDLDHNLVERCLSGDEAAWEDLVRTHTRRVYGLCYRFTGKDGEAQDLTQEVFLRVYRTLRTFRAAEGAFTTWLARLTRNLLIDNYRRTRQERLTDSIEEQLPRIEDSVSLASRPAARTDAMLAGREASEILQAGLQKLSPELREAVILRDLQDMEYREIAGILRIPEGTVKSRLNRGRAELARVLRRQKVLV